MNDSCAQGPWPASTDVPGPAVPQTLRAWLRAQRIARGLSIAEMGRRLHRAAKAAGDNTVPSVAIVTSYVRRWEEARPE
jgi:hypothetical protein